MFSSIVARRGVRFLRSPDRIGSPVRTELVRAVFPQNALRSQRLSSKPCRIFCEFSSDPTRWMEIQLVSSREMFNEELEDPAAPGTS